MELDYTFWTFLVRWLHVLSGFMWIGLLWYFNFVQGPSMPEIPDDQKPAISKVIAPRALFWFRWAALSTIVFGLILAYMSGYIEEALALGLMDNSAKHASIGFGMWMGLIMAANVWFIIWPKQQIALGLGVKGRMQKLVQLRRVDAFHGLFPVDQVLGNHVDGDLQRRLGGSLAGPRLQHPQLAALDGELHVLHVGVMPLKPAAHLYQVGVDIR